MASFFFTSLEQMKHLILFLVLFSVACKESHPVATEQEVMRLRHIPAMTPDSSINILIEIPAGTTSKWEYNKEEAVMQMDSIDGLPRKINYLGYPANYGMIPNTLSDKRKGGDGDALDVIVLGDAIASATIEECRVLGVLLLRDRGETDDKLVAAQVDSPFAEMKDLDELDESYPGMLDIIETWFLNYKGKDGEGQRLMSSCGFGSRDKALEVLQTYFHRYLIVQGT